MTKETLPCKIIINKEKAYTLFSVICGHNNNLFFFSVVLFSPLTSLRDDLVLKIQDSEGNEISHTGLSLIITIPFDN